MSIAVSLFLVAAMCEAIKDKGDLALNLSDSLPGKLFFVARNSPRESIAFLKGDHVAFTHPLIPGMVIKRVAGLPGECVSHRDGVAFVEDRRIGEIFSKSHKVRSISPGFVGVIPEGYVFVAGLHPRSFDSRYKEMGLVKKEKVRGKAYRVL